MDNHHGDACCHGHQPAVASVHQTLTEMEFERGIWSAALNNDINKVMKCIQNGDVNKSDNSGYTALHYAARYGHTEVCRLLIDNGACVNATTPSGLSTPLHRAAYCGHIDVTRLLLQRGAETHRQDDDGMTALHKACERGHLDVASILLTKNPQCCQTRDKKQRTPLDCVPPDNSELRQLLSKHSSS